MVRWVKKILVKKREKGHLIVADEVVEEQSRIDDHNCGVDQEVSTQTDEEEKMKIIEEQVALEDEKIQQLETETIELKNQLASRDASIRDLKNELRDKANETRWLRVIISSALGDLERAVATTRGAFSHPQTAAGMKKWFGEEHIVGAEASNEGRPEDYVGI